MRRMLLLLVGAVVVVVSAVSAAAGSAGSGQARWVMRDLGTLGGVSSSAVAINERGWVVGRSETKQSGEWGVVVHAFLWRQGRMADLGVLAGDYASEAVAVNERGLVVGVSSSAGNDPTTHAVAWQAGSMRALETLGGEEGWAVAVNERGQITGAAASSAQTALGGDEVTHAVLWQDGQVEDLGVKLVADTPDGPLTGSPTDINERGQVVGVKAGSRVFADDSYQLWERGFLWQKGRVTILSRSGNSTAVAVNERGQVAGAVSGRGGKMHAFLWQAGKMRDLGTLGGAESRASALNERGQVVGSSDSASGQRHAFRWQNGRMIDLGLLLGAEDEAVAINERGQVVGRSGGRAFIWQQGKMTALPGGSASSAIAINEHNQIVGWATTKTGKRHAVLWTLRSG